ncbi:DUF726 domain-containing protein [Agrococcus jejuensis]|uniref:DUF726 domain-containing protein n=1 Tax=Agrococcus jejuensis TaxID=399736 RepID=A0A1G8CFS2_9MICO|nr:DUF726 domain-containing protein [Agrococcus jejuensis]SDH44218.1 Protein of unknown function [Agrococcus jejuensis]
MDSYQYIPVGDVGFRCTVVSTHEGSSRHIELTVDDVNVVAEPALVGDAEFIASDALRENLLNFGVNEFGARHADDDEQRKAFSKAAERNAKVALQLAEFMHFGSYQTRRGWCSCCFVETTHNEVDGQFSPAVFLCSGCGAATTPCFAAGCRYMARRHHFSVGLAAFCGEHRHEIRSFERANERYAGLDAIDDLRTFDAPNLARLTTTVIVAGAGVAVVAPMVFFAAPAIGGALGASGLIGPALSGAAASSHGLAFLGGGAIAAGGLGMAGGTAVVTASGAALGGALGAVTATAYLEDDSSFAITKLKDGVGSPVLVASGFMTEKQGEWHDWQRIVLQRYPENPVYRVHWGAKELAAFGLMAGVAGAKAAAGGVVRAFAMQAWKKGANIIPPLGAALIAADVAKNPWTVAKNRAAQTAAVLADLLARVDDTSFVLVGHSLGARVMLATAELLATKSGGPRIEDVHLLGAAVGVGGDWKLLNESVSGSVYNYHSSKDQVLAKVYPTAELGKKAIGKVGFGTSFPKIVDVDVSDDVATHFMYHDFVDLQRPA